MKLNRKGSNTIIIFFLIIVAYFFFSSYINISPNHNKTFKGIFYDYIDTNGQKISVADFEHTQDWRNIIASVYSEHYYDANEFNCEDYAKDLVNRLKNDKYKATKCYVILKEKPNKYDDIFHTLV